MNESRFRYLFQAYFDKSATSAERDELMALMATSAYDEQVKKLITDSWQQFSSRNKLFSDEQGAHMLAGILQKTQPRPIPVIVPAKRSDAWVRITSAAAIFLLVIGSLFVLLNKQPERYNTQNTALQKASPDTIMPGGNKAILTLSDGSHILLDSTRQGTLATQGNAKIMNLQTAVLMYHTAKDDIRPVVYNSLSTSGGGQYQLILSDGTKVWLNASSSIRFPTVFTGNERNVTISGEVYFEVAKNTAMPFTVGVQDIKVQVLGTHFNIMAYADENTINTTLLEGSVKIYKSTSGTLLVPGQEARISNTGDIKVVEADQEEVMAWKNGWFQFDASGIEKVMRQVSRWYDVEVVYEGKIPAGHFSGMVSRENNITQVLKILQGSGVRFRIQGRKLIVYTDKF